MKGIDYERSTTYKSAQIAQLLATMNNVKLIVIYNQNAFKKNFLRVIGNHSVFVSNTIFCLGEQQIVRNHEQCETNCHFNHEEYILDFIAIGLLCIVVNMQMKQHQIFKLYCYYYCSCCRI